MIDSKPISFEASLGRRERWFFYVLGCGLFLGMPLFMGIVFSLAFGTLKPLALPAPFISAAPALSSTLRKHA